MPFIILIAIVILVAGAIEAGFFPPFHAITIIRMRNGFMALEKGQLRGNVAEHVESILRGAQVREGFVAVTPGQRVYFSRHIPQDIHQRLRNVLLNSWR